MVQTRGMRRTKRSIYRSRVKSSHCRGQTRKCIKRNGCKRTASGRRRSYCRKSRNRRA